MSRPTWAWSAVDPRDPRSPGGQSFQPDPHRQDQQQDSSPEHGNLQAKKHADIEPSQKGKPDNEYGQQELHPRSLPPLTPEDYGPVAPEPTWEPPLRAFDRERFLLQCFAVALIAQYAILTAGIYICNSSGIRRLEKGLPPLPPENNKNCLDLSTKLDNTFELSVSTILALLGGASLAAGAARRGGPPDRR